MGQTRFLPTKTTWKPKGMIMKKPKNNQQV